MNTEKLTPLLIFVVSVQFGVLCRILVHFIIKTLELINWYYINGHKNVKFM